MLSRWLRNSSLTHCNFIPKDFFADPSANPFWKKGAAMCCSSVKEVPSRLKAQTLGLAENPHWTNDWTRDKKLQRSCKVESPSTTRQQSWHITRTTVSATRSIWFFRYFHVQLGVTSVPQPTKTTQAEAWCSAAPSWGCLGTGATAVTRSTETPAEPCGNSAGKLRDAAQTSDVVPNAWASVSAVCKKAFLKGRRLAARWAMLEGRVPATSGGSFFLQLPQARHALWRPSLMGRHCGSQGSAKTSHLLISQQWTSLERWELSRDCSFCFWHCITLEPLASAQNQLCTSLLCFSTKAEMDTNPPGSQYTGKDQHFCGSLL